MIPVRAQGWFYSVLVFGWVGSGVLAEQDTNILKSITIHECVERALAHNLEIYVERVNPSIAQWGIVREQGAFEPALTGQATYQENTTPFKPDDPNRLIFGSSTEEQTLALQTGLIGKLPTGAQYGLNALDTASASTATSNQFTQTGTLPLITVTQPLSRNFGLGPNLALLRVARKSQQIAAQTFANLVINTVSDAVNAYYELVFAIEDHKAKLDDLNRARALLAENRERVKIGVLSPLDVTQAEAGAAEREEAVIIAQRVIQDQEDILKRFISQNVSEFDGVSLIPAEYPVVEMVETDVPRSINTALLTRPDFIAAHNEVERRDILVKFNRNQLWPQIDLQGSYGLNTRARSFGDFVDNAARGDSPQWSIGVVMTVPLGNRVARANYHASRLDAEQALLMLKVLEQNIVVQVRNAVRQVETNLKRADASRVASRLAEESLKAEQEKLRAGTSTSFLVLQAQAQLSAAQSAEIRARADYSKSLIDLARAEGTTLRKQNIDIDTEMKLPGAE